MNKRAEFTTDEIDAAVTGKNFYTWEQIARDPRLWIALIRKAMAKTGNGYRRHSLRHSGNGDDRREDKLEGEFSYSPLLRRYNQRYAATRMIQTPRQQR